MNKRFQFTSLRLEKLTCPEGRDRIYYDDDGAECLEICVTPAGTKTFYIYRRFQGKPVRFKLGTWPGDLSVDEARKKARIWNGKIADNIDPRAESRAARDEITFGEVFTLHLDHAKAHNRTWKENESQFKRYLHSWRARRLSNITRADVQAMHARIGENHGKTTANRVLALIHHVFAKTAANAGYTGVNPAHGIEKFREQSRERFLHADELPKFFKALDDETELFRDFFTLALLTGARRANLQAMRWEELNLERALWRIPGEGAKSGEPITVPLVPDAVEILERRHALRVNEYVFPGRGKNGHIVEPKTAWQRVLDRAGLKDLRLHDLRRTFGSWQAGAGVSLHVIGKSMGHKNQSTTAIYARLAIDPIREGVNAGTSAMMAAAKGESN